MAATTKTDLRKKLAKAARTAVVAGAVTFAVGAIAGCSSTGGPFSCKGMSSCKGHMSKNGCSGKNGCGGKK